MPCARTGDAIANRSRVAALVTCTSGSQASTTVVVLNAKTRSGVNSQFLPASFSYPPLDLRGCLQAGGERLLANGFACREGSSVKNDLHYPGVTREGLDGPGPLVRMPFFQHRGEVQTDGQVGGARLLSRI